MKFQLVALWCSLLFCTAASAETLRFRGYAFDLKSDRYLYTEVHEQIIENGQWRRGRIRYFDAQGRIIGDKTLDFGAHATIPLYRFELPAERYVEAITAVGGGEVKLHKQADGKSQDKTLKAGGDSAADSGFHNYLLAHFDELLAGRTVTFQFIVAGNLDAYRFRARRIGDKTLDGKAALRIRVEPDSVLRWLVDPLELGYDPNSKKLLEYRGISNVHDPATGKAYNARIVFPDQPPAGAPPSLPPLEIGGE